MKLPFFKYCGCGNDFILFDLLSLGFVSPEVFFKIAVERAASFEEKVDTPAGYDHFSAQSSAQAKCTRWPRSRREHSPRSVRGEIDRQMAHCSCAETVRESDHSPPNKGIIQALCHRQRGIGADGILFLTKGVSSPYAMRIYNSDGSEAEMCGNGLRCVGRHLFEMYGGKADALVEVSQRGYPLTQRERAIGVEMGAPTLHFWDQPIDVQGKTIRCHWLNTGVPHLVFETEECASFDLGTYGAALRNHPRFSPNGTNVSAIQRVGERSLTIRTYERGVEAETQACGTGAAAAAFCAYHNWGMESQISVITASRETLNFTIDKESHYITMEGEALCCFSGSVDIFSLMRS